LKSKSVTKSKYVTKSKDYINLDEIKNPHPEIVRAWKESGVQDHYFDFNDVSEFKNEKRLFMLAASSSPPAKITHKIQSIYRKKVGNKEYCFLHEALQSLDPFVLRNNFVML
jgi:hypothetical protein